MDSKYPGFAVSIWPDPAAAHILDGAYRPVDRTHLLMIRPPGLSASQSGMSKPPFLWDPIWKPFLRMMSDI